MSQSDKIFVIFELFQRFYFTRSMSFFTSVIKVGSRLNAQEKILKSMVQFASCQLPLEALYQLNFLFASIDWARLLSEFLLLVTTLQMQSKEKCLCG